MPRATSEQPPDPRSRLPSVDRVLNAAPELVERFGHQCVTECIRHHLADLRTRAVSGEEAALQLIVSAVGAALESAARPSLRSVFNLSGTVLHTNLGRAPLPEEAVAAMVRAAGACNLEYDLERGARGERDLHCEAQLCALTGAEAATVVNNNAAAVLLTLNTLALNREVPVSRGELIEIGGAFRIPDIMARAGCQLVEVGTTNRTHRRDYAAAIGPGTALLMKVHPSNYEVRGFTREVGIGELAALAREHGLPCVMDQGSGTLVDLRDHGLPHEPTARDVLQAGADLVAFSGDKLLGGPQCGIVAGRRELVERLRSNPLKRALRLDKVTLAALSAVLELYRHPERLAERLPTLRVLCRPDSEIRSLGESLLPPVRAILAGRYAVTLRDCSSQIGSGALPVDLLPSTALCIAPPGLPGGTNRDIEHLAARLRALQRPVIGRLRNGALWLDLRCLEEPEALLEQLRSGLG